MGWTAPRTWVAGETVTAALMNAHVRDNLLALNGYATKTADESVTSSTTLQNDDHLSYSIGATGTYIFDLFLFAVSAADAAGDLKVAFTFPAGTLHFMADGLDATLASGSNGTSINTGILSATSGSSSVNFGLSTTVVGIRVHGILVATATGTLQTQWAQAASNANASTVKAGSHLLVRQVA